MMTSAYKNLSSKLKHSKPNREFVFPEYVWTHQELPPLSKTPWEFPVRVVCYNWRIKPHHNITYRSTYFLTELERQHVLEKWNIIAWTNQRKPGLIHPSFLTIEFIPI